MKAYCSLIGISEAIDGIGLGVVSAIDGCPVAMVARRSEDDVCRLRIVIEMGGGADRFHGERIIHYIFGQAQRDDIAGTGRGIGPHAFELLLGSVT